MDDIDSRKVVVSRLPPGEKKSDLKAFFSQYGEVKGVFLSDCTALVEFSTKEDAVNLVKQNSSLSYKDAFLELKSKERKEEEVQSTVQDLSFSVVQKIVSQVEFYFSQKNLPRLWSFIDENDDKMVSLEKICSFREMKSLLGISSNKHITEKIVTNVANALKTSGLLVISEDGKKVRSKTEFAQLKNVMDDIYSRTVVVSPLPPGEEISDLKAFFSQYGEVKSVYLSKITAFVEFSTKEDAVNLVKQNLSESYKDAVLELKSKESIEKNVQNQGRKRKRIEENKDVVQGSGQKISLDQNSNDIVSQAANNTVLVLTDHVIYGSKYYPASLILFTKESVKMKSEESSASFFECNLEEIFRIEVQLTSWNDVAKLEIQVSKNNSVQAETASETSGVELVELLVPKWSEHQERINSIDLRYKSVLSMGPERDFSLFDRPYKKVDRMENDRLPIPICSVWLQLEKYRRTLDLQTCGDGEVDESTVIFGIRWCIPEFHYLVESDINKEKHLPSQECSRLKLHFMSLEKGSPKRRAAPLPSKWDRKKTEYLGSILAAEFPDLNQPRHSAKYHGARFNKHLANQNQLDQKHAIELMLSCHDRFQMARLLDDIRGRARLFATRENCYIEVFQAPEGHPGKLQMKIRDLVTLARDLLGPSFHPKIFAKEEGKYLVIHEITIHVDEDGVPVYFDYSYSNYDHDNVIIF